MKYISIALVIIFLALVIGFWIKKTPPASAPSPVTTAQEETPATSAPQETAAPTPEPEKKIIKTKTIQGMKIETTKEGTGVEIKAGQTAVMKYTGKLQNGTIFDATDKHGGTPFEFVLGAGMVIKGWDLGVAGMKVGEMRTLTIPADLGYGAQGAGGVIPPNATLIFDVELVGIK